MKKNEYISPKVDIIEICLSEGMLFSASDGTNGILGNGGTTSDPGFTDADVKDDRGGFFDDEW